jgi:UDP-N-acetylmuramate--alanine ligase
MTAQDTFPAHIFFAGIGGIGVSALAQVALSRGSRVSGSDIHPDIASNPALARLVAAGATVYAGHQAQNLAVDTDLVVASAAIASSSPELAAAAQLEVPIVSRAEFLGRLMSAHIGRTIAIAGTHGKTTTTSMAGVALVKAGCNPTVFVGGEVPQLGGNVVTGTPGGPFVAEACEAYDSFLWLVPDVAIITNIEPDHLDHFGTEDCMMASFRTFAGAVLANGGALILSRDDRGVRKLAEDLPTDSAIAWYSTDDAANVALDSGSSFEWRGRLVKLHVPGSHNVSNALAVLTLCDVLPGVSCDSLIEGIQQFHGVNRRQQLLGTIKLGGGDVTVMDDYAHHPTEIAATLQALATAYTHRRTVLVFQPHLYSRTRDFLPDFATVLSEVGLLVLAPIYAAREEDPGDISSAILAKEIQRRHADKQVLLAHTADDVPGLLKGVMQADDLLVFMGAGDIIRQADRLDGLIRV